MIKLEKKNKFFIIVFLLQLFLTSCQTQADSTPLGEEKVLFKKLITVDNKKHKLLIRKTPKNSIEKNLCDTDETCSTATMDIVYTLNDNIEWKHSPSIANCSYDITLDVFESDIVFNIENNIANVFVGYESLCSGSVDPTVVKGVGYKNKSEYMISSGTKNTYSKHSEVRALFDKISKKRKTYFLDNEASLITQNNTGEKNWVGNFSFNVNGIQHMGESHNFTQIITLGESSCMINATVDDEKLEAEDCSIISSTKKEINIQTSDNKNYKLVKDNDEKFRISGTAVYMINPPTESYPLSID